MVVVLVASMTVTILWLLQDAAQDERNLSIRNAATSYSRWESQRAELMLSNARAMSRAPYLRAALEITELDAATIDFSARELREIALPDLLIIVDARGQIIADAGESRAKNTGSLLRDNKINFVGEELSSYIRDAGHIYHISLAPIVSGERLLGAVLVGARLDRAASIAISEGVTGVQNLLWFSGAAFPRNNPLSDELILRATQQQMVTSNGVLLGSRMVIGAHPLGNAGHIIFFSETNLSASRMSSLQRIMIAAALLLIIAGFFAARFFALGISKPIADLKHSAIAFGAGALETRATTGSIAELASLVNSFNTMADNIQQHRSELVKSRDIAQAASRTKSEFLARVSHEIRTPLNGIWGVTQLLQLDSSVTQEQQRHLDMIASSCNSLVAIINDVLDFSKIEAGKMQIERTPFDLRGLVESCVDLLRGSAASKSLHIDLDIAPTLRATYIGDPTRIRQLLMNFGSNAVKFTSNGRIVVSVTDATDGSGVVRFTVTDTGKGIRPELKEKIFESFTQEDNSTTRQFGGTGLGLAICKELVALMNGTIGVESAVGKGSTFWFQLPLECDVVTADDRPVVLSAAGFAEYSGALNGTRVLLVEDNAINRTVAHGMLQHLGCFVVEACDGIEAISVLEKHAFHVVLMDCQMPRLDGFDTTRRLRRNELEKGLARIPIIALTANYYQEDRDRCIAAGFDGFVSKPFTVSELHGSIAKQLEAIESKLQAC
jgi:signal transduction histidine kinase